MRWLLFSLLMLAMPGLSVAAELSVTLSNGAVVRLFESQCSNKVILKLINEEYHPMFRAGNVRLGDIKRELCWMPHSGDVLIMDEAGEGGIIPIMAFTPSVSG